jgi:hypothetical protein
MASRGIVHIMVIVKFDGVIRGFVGWWLRRLDDFAAAPLTLGIPLGPLRYPSNVHQPSNVQSVHCD